MPMKPGSTKNLLLRLDPELAGRLQTVADVEGRPVSDVVREAIAALVEQRRSDKRFLRLLEDNLARHQQALDLLDVAAAERALDRARPGSDPADPAGQAAVLLHALVRERPLRDGNQQVALAAMLQFLAVNGWDVDSDPPGPVADMVTRLAAGTAGTTAVADMLAPRLRPSGRAASRVKEAPMRPRPELPLIGRIREATLRTRRKGMFMQFTDRARRVVVLAENEARGLGHGFTGTEHLLLGLLAEGEGVAALALESLGISLEEARDRVEEIAG